ncbi:hypothetical protein [Methanolacinia paynteri]|uniref:hypothetical protein n=1 Tax=Methanolacinia paynteri TaxID=230356 RepID=UPI001B801FD6|nr:hypothetical protein [Methanolacinia paynteri]
MPVIENKRRMIFNKNPVNIAKVVIKAVAIVVDNNLLKKIQIAENINGIKKNKTIIQNKLEFFLTAV